MKVKLMASAIGAVLLIGAGYGAAALSIEIRLTPASIKEQRPAFRIQAKDRDGFKEFEVTITEKPGKLSPFVHGDLRLNTGDA